MAKILIISAVFPPEPVVSAMLSRDIAQELSKNNEVTVLCPRPTRPEGFRFDSVFSPDNYKVIRLNSYTCAPSKMFGRLRESYSFGKHCAKYILAHAREAACVYMNSWPMFSQYLIIKAAKKNKIPCVIHIQDIYPESLTSKLPNLVKRLVTFLFLFLDRYILHNATRIAGISQNAISYLAATRKVDKDKFVLIRNWQNDDQFLNYIPVNRVNRDFIFMYVGSISPSAGVEVLIHSFHIANLPESILKIVGTGSDKENCMAIAHRLGNDKIEFTEVSPENVPEIQSQSDVLLLPLKKGISMTATPSKFTAYLLSGKPVIACVEKESDVANIIREAKCGFVAEPESIESIVPAMKHTYKLNKSELKELGSNGKEYAIRHLSKKMNLQKLISVIETTTNGL